MYESTCFIFLITGGTTNWSGYTCSICKGVKVTANPNKYKDKMIKLEGQINDLKYAQKVKPVFDTYVCESGTKIDLNDFVDLDGDIYNKLTFWKSSDTSVATVSSKGILTGKKAGTVTISVKTNISGKTAKEKFIIYDNFQVLDSNGNCFVSYEKEIYTSDEPYMAKMGETIQLVVEFGKETIEHQVTYKCESELVTISETGLHVYLHRHKHGIRTLSGGQVLLRTRQDGKLHQGR